MKRERKALRRRRFLTWRNAIASFVVALAVWGVAATGWLLFGSPGDESAVSDEPPFVAVLPLANRSGLEEDAAFVLLGQKEEAIRAAQRAVELMPISKDAVDGPGLVRNLAAIYARFGAVDAAVEGLERYLSVPAPESIESILLDRLIDPVRDDPRFRTLLAKYE